jgi:hypothetical protein
MLAREVLASLLCELLKFQQPLISRTIDAVIPNVEFAGHLLSSWLPAVPGGML